MKSSLKVLLGLLLGGLLFGPFFVTADVPSGSVRIHNKIGGADLQAVVTATAGGALQVECVGGTCAGGGSTGTSSTFGAAFPATGTAAGFSDGTNMQGGRVFDVDSGAGTQFVVGMNLRGTASGGSIELATATNPLRIDPTGTTTQPVSGTVTANAGSGTFLVGDGAGPLTVDGTVAATQSGTWTVQPGNTANTTAWLVTGTGGTFPITGNLTGNQAINTVQLGGTAISLNTGVRDAGTQRVTIATNDVVPASQSGTWTITANIGTTGGLALDTSVNGLLRAQASTTSGQTGPLVQGAVTTGAPTYTTAQTSPLSLTTTGALRVDGSGVTQPVSLSGNQATNVTQFGGTNISTGTGASGAGIPRVTVANDSTVILGAGAATIGSLAANQSINTAQINGVTPLMGNGVTGTGSQRVTIASDNTAFSVNATLQTGANVIGALTANQSVNVAQINGVTTTMGNGVSGTGVQRVTLASDSTGQVTLATGANTIGALTANQSVNVAQINGITPLMGNGVTGTGSHRVTISSDNSNSAGIGGSATGSVVPSAARYVGGIGSGNLTGITICDNWTAISQTTGTQLFAGVSAKKTYICAINIVSATAQNIALVGGTGTVCATGTHAIAGGTTAATGWNLAANGGLTQGSGAGVIMQAGTAADNVCLLQSGSGQISGAIAWTQY